MTLKSVKPHTGFVLEILLDDDRRGLFDMSPYLCLEAFSDLNQSSEFDRVHNGGYFIEWPCGADLSIDTIEAHLQPWTDQN